MNIYSQKFNISFLDIGKDNSLTNKGSLRLMQEIACKHASLDGYGPNDITRTGLVWIILNWKLKILYRPKWAETVTIHTWCRCIKKSFFYRDFEIYDTKKNLVAIATSKWILFDINKQNIYKVTPEMKNKPPVVQKFVFKDNLIEKLQEPENSKFIYEYQTRRADIDTNHHVNNLKYLDYAYEALPKNIFANMDFLNIEIMYKHEIKFEDTISLFYSANKNNEHFITIKDKNRKKLHAIIKLY